MRLKSRLNAIAKAIPRIQNRTLRAVRIRSAASLTLLAAACAANAGEPRYDEASHQLRHIPVEMTFANGLCTGIVAGAETVIAQAVEESA